MAVLNTGSMTLVWTNFGVLPQPFILFLLRVFLKLSVYEGVLFVT